MEKEKYVENIDIVVSENSDLIYEFLNGGLDEFIIDVEDDVKLKVYKSEMGILLELISNSDNFSAPTVKVRDSEEESVRVISESSDLENEIVEYLYECCKN